MRVRIEVVDENEHKADDMIQDIACDLFDKYPKAEADLGKMNNEKAVEIFMDN